MLTRSIVCWCDEICLISSHGEVNQGFIQTEAWMNINDVYGIILLFQGHIETIFDCKFKPEKADLLATASFDGTIKVWDINTMTCVSIITINLSLM